MLLFSRKNKNKKAISGCRMGSLGACLGLHVPVGAGMISLPGLRKSLHFKSNEKSRCFKAAEMCMLSFVFLIAMPMQRKREWEFSWPADHEIS